MEVFYIAVLAIATGILILILTSVGVLLRKSNTEVPWPPTAGRCPDFWTEVSEGENKGNCYHEGVNIGLAAAAAANKAAMAIDLASDHPTTCDKRSWAKTNGVQWDGVTNYNKCK